MIVVATIPVGLTGIALEHTFRTIFAEPAAATVLLFINGPVLLAAEWLRRSRPPGPRTRRGRSGDDHRRCRGWVVSSPRAAGRGGQLS